MEQDSLLILHSLISDTKPMSFNFFINVKCTISRKCYRTGRKIFAVVHPSNYSQPSLWRMFTEQHIIFSDPNRIHFQKLMCLGGDVGLGDRSHFITLQLPIPHLLASTSQGHFTEEWNYTSEWCCPKPPAGGAQDCGWRTQGSRKRRVSGKSFCFHWSQCKHLLCSWPLTPYYYQSNQLGLPMISHSTGESWRIHLSKRNKIPFAPFSEKFQLQTSHISAAFHTISYHLVSGNKPGHRSWSSPVFWPAPCGIGTFKLFANVFLNQDISKKTLPFHFLLKNFKIWQQRAHLHSAKMSSQQGREALRAHFATP